MKPVSQKRPIPATFIALFVLAPALWAQLDPQTAATTAKKPGTVRIGLLPPDNRLTGQSDPQAGEPIREGEAKLMAPSIETVSLRASQPDQALVEARSANCDYILSAALTQQTTGSGGRFGKLMNLKNMQIASQVASVGPGSDNSRMAAVVGSQVMEQQLQNASRGVKANSDVTLQYTLTEIGGNSVLNESATTRSKQNGEDVLPTLLSQEIAKVQGVARPSAGASLSGSGSATASAAAPALSLTTYKNYDFIAGDKVIFDDDFTSTPDGDFPEKWELLSGQAAVNVQAGNPALTISTGDPSLLKARIKEATLGPQFTLEFDVFGTESQWGPEFYFNTDHSHTPSVRIRTATVEFHPREGDPMNGQYPGDIAFNNYIGHWHHVAIAYKQPQLKVYVDQYRVLYVPDAKMTPQTLALGGEASDTSKLVFAHVRLATGGGAHYVGKQFTEAKIVSHSINFDVDTAALRPESMGALNEIKKLMDTDPALKFEVDGHTDNTGAAPHNLTLSQQRAEAVKTQLVAMGIDASRLTAKGLGDSKPLGPNDTAEGKANNRRVEFVRF